MLTPELATFCQSGVSIVAASRDSGGRPVVGRAVACTVIGDELVRLLLRRSSNGALLQAVAASGPLAVTFTKPSTHKSLQLKAVRAEMSELGPGDARVAASQAVGLRTDLVGHGYTATFAAGYCAFAADDLIALEFLPNEAFQQTPGPNAGTPMKQP